MCTKPGQVHPATVTHVISKSGRACRRKEAPVEASITPHGTRRLTADEGREGDAPINLAVMSPRQCAGGTSRRATAGRDSCVLGTGQQLDSRVSWAWTRGVSCRCGTKRSGRSRPRHVQSGIGREEAAGSEPKARSVHGHDRPVFGPCEVRDPHRVPEHDVHVFDLTIGLGPLR